MAEWLGWIPWVLAALSITGSFALGTFILLHRMGRATGRFDRRERD